VELGTHAHVQELVPNEGCGSTDVFGIPRAVGVGKELREVGQYLDLV